MRAGDADRTGAPVAPLLVAPVVHAAPVVPAAPIAAAFAPPTSVFPPAMPPTVFPPAMPPPVLPMMQASASALPTAATAMPALAAALPAAPPPPLPVLPPAAQGKLPLPPGTVSAAGKETPADYLRALSLKQPFCSALVLGKRKQESRTWKIKLPHDGTGLWVAAHSPAKAAPAGVCPRSSLTLTLAPNPSPHPNPHPHPHPEPSPSPNPSPDPSPNPSPDPSPNPSPNPSPSLALTPTLTR